MNDITTEIRAKSLEETERVFRRTDEHPTSKEQFIELLDKYADHCTKLPNWVSGLASMRNDLIEAYKRATHSEVEAIDDDHVCGVCEGTQRGVCVCGCTAHEPRDALVTLSMMVGSEKIAETFDSIASYRKFVLQAITDLKAGHGNANTAADRPSAITAGEAAASDGDSACPAVPASVAIYDKCPFTGRPHFMDIEHPELGLVPTYGGPFDSFTIPVPDDDDERTLRSERYDHDAGNWVEGGEPLAMHVVTDEEWVDLHSMREERAAQPPAPAPVFERPKHFGDPIRPVWSYRGQHSLFKGEAWERYAKDVELERDAALRGTHPAVTHVAILEHHDAGQRVMLHAASYKAVIVPPGQSLDFDEGAATRKWLWPYLGRDHHLVDFIEVASSETKSYDCIGCGEVDVPTPHTYCEDCHRKHERIANETGEGR